MSVSIISVLIILFASVMGGFASFLLKKGMSNFELKRINVLKSILTNFNLIFGAFFYAFAAAITIVAYKGGNLSILFPITSFSYVVGMIFGFKFLNERINMYKVFGILLIIIGIIITVF